MAADGYDHEAIENAGDITITMMTSGVATDNDFETEQLPGTGKKEMAKRNIRSYQASR